MNPANAVRFGAFLLGMPKVPERPSSDATRARLATLLSRDLWQGPDEFDWLMRRFTDGQNPWVRRAAAMVLRKMQTRGHVRFDECDKRWYSTGYERKQARARALRAAQQAAEIDQLLRWSMSDVVGAAVTRAKFRAWLLNAAQYVIGRDLTMEEQFRFADIAQRRFSPSFHLENTKHGN